MADDTLHVRFAHSETIYRKWLNPATGRWEDYTPPPPDPNVSPFVRLDAADIVDVEPHLRPLLPPE